MEYQRRPSTISTLSFSETDLESAGTGFDNFSVENEYNPVNQRFSTPLILISPGTSVNNSVSSIPSLSAMTANSNHGEVEVSPHGLLSPLQGGGGSQEKNGLGRPKNFTLDLNGGDSTDGTDRGTPPDNNYLPMDATSLDQGTRTRGCDSYESKYVNKQSLAQDLGALSTMPEFCDVTFLVGEGRQPVCGVRAILAARSRVFRKMLYMDITAVIGGKKSKKKQNFRPPDGYVEKFDFRGQPTVIVRDFEPQVFKLLIDFTHTGSVILQSSTLLGLMNAADHYGLEELKHACSKYIEKCISKDTVCVMLTSAERYIQYKSTKMLIRKIFEYVDVHAEDILSMEDFANLPQHIVRIVLGREELRASESLKFDAAYQWCIRYCRSYPEADLKTTFEPFLDVINYDNIPARHLMQRVKKSGVVDNARILTALARQADPSAAGGFREGPNQRPLSAIPSSMFAVTDVGAVPKLQKMPTDSAIQTQREVQSTGRFRRVQSSGNRADIGLNRATQFASNPALVDIRDNRGCSAPLSPADRTDGPINLDEIYLQESEIHPLRVNDRDHLSTGSSSHLSILTTPPLSPAQSLLSTGSHKGSLLSVSSGDSFHHCAGVVSPANGERQSTRSQLTTSASQGNLKKHTYNPQALDAIVKLGVQESEKR